MQPFSGSNACVNCQATLRPGVKFCTACGAVQPTWTEPPSTPRKSQPAAAPPDPKKFTAKSFSKVEELPKQDQPTLPPPEAFQTSKPKEDTSGPPIWAVPSSSPSHFRQVDSSIGKLVVLALLFVLFMGLVWWGKGSMEDRFRSKIVQKAWQACSAYATNQYQAAYPALKKVTQITVSSNPTNIDLDQKNFQHKLEGDLTVTYIANNNVSRFHFICQVARKGDTNGRVHYEVSQLWFQDTIPK